MIPRFPSARRRGGLRLAAFLCGAFALSGACRRGPEVRIVRERGPAAPAPVPPSPIPKDVALTTGEAQAVRSFLAQHPGWQLASDSDARPSDDADDMTPLYGVYHPYFVRGDLDDDGVQDFVTAFVDRGKPAAAPWFTVVVFPGDGRGGFRPPEVIESEISLQRGDLSVDRDAIVITPDLAEDDTTRRYRWDSRKRRFEYVTGDSSSTPDQAPSTRI
ncbi:MAG TPA: hypothetical protein VFS34_01590 [Thermoanaerobaculia bacterium]|nr:hypothetical protein [Thermoanaerobaculia bacterium]